MHTIVNIADKPKKLPESVSFHNPRKWGLDLLGQMIPLYTSGATSRVWSVYFFYNVLDNASTNSWPNLKPVTN